MPFPNIGKNGSQLCVLTTCLTSWFFRTYFAEDHTWFAVQDKGRERHCPKRKFIAIDWIKWGFPKPFDPQTLKPRCCGPYLR